MNSIWMRQDIENRPFRRLTLLRTVANEMSRGLFGACGQRDPSGAVPGTGRELQRKNQEGGGDYQPAKPRISGVAPNADGPGEEWLIPAVGWDGIELDPV